MTLEILMTLESQSLRGEAASGRSAAENCGSRTRRV